MSVIAVGTRKRKVKEEECIMILGIEEEINNDIFQHMKS